MGIGKVAVHLLEPNENGPIKSMGLPGTASYGKIRRFSVVCDPLAGLPVTMKSGVSYTGSHNCATCEKCIDSDYYRHLEKQRQLALSGKGGLPKADPEDFPEGVSPEQSKPSVPAEVATDVEVSEGVPVEVTSDPENPEKV